LRLQQRVFYERTGLEECCRNKGLFKDVLRKLGRDDSVCATLLSQAGASLKDVQAQRGHAHISTTTDIYTQRILKHRHEAVAKMAELVTSGAELTVWSSAPKTAG